MVWSQTRSYEEMMVDEFDFRSADMSRSGSGLGDPRWVVRGREERGGGGCTGPNLIPCAVHRSNASPTARCFAAQAGYGTLPVLLPIAAVFQNYSTLGRTCGGRGP